MLVRVLLYVLRPDLRVRLERLLSLHRAFVTVAPGTLEPPPLPREVSESPPRDDAGSPQPHGNGVTRSAVSTSSRGSLEPGQARTPSGLLEEVGRFDCDLVVVTRQALGEPARGQVAAIRALPDRPEVVVVSDVENPEERAAFLGAGVLAVLYEGLDDTAMGRVWGTLVARLSDEGGRRLRAAHGEFPPSLRDFVSLSPSMQAFLSVVNRIAAAESSLLILGETGVGKERLARAIHNEGPRASRPFVSVNCAALPEALLESELFGHEQGAYTGASRARRGQFELAHHGTIFLDEVGEMPVHLQAKLLQVLQDRRIRPLGGEKSVEVDVRIIAATNRDLEAEMQAHRFREDLFYRLSVVSLTVPPLRERREDIPSLIDSYLDHFASRFGRPEKRMAPDAMAALVRYEWPGNVRELINVAERAVLLCSTDIIAMGDLPDTIRRHRDSLPEVLPQDAEEPHENGSPEWVHKPWKEARTELLDALERRYLHAVLTLYRGRIKDVAEHAGMETRSLYTKMQRLGLDKADYK